MGCVNKKKIKKYAPFPPQLEEKKLTKVRMTVNIIKHLYVNKNRDLCRSPSPTASLSSLTFSASSRFSPMSRCAQPVSNAY